MTAATATTPTSGAADLPEALRPVEPVALIASIQELNAWEARADGELLTPAEGESIILVLHELKRLLALAAGQATAAQPAAPARDLAAVIKGAADKLDAAVRCHPNAVDTLIHEALEILDGDREPDATPTSHGQAPAGAALPESWVPLTIHLEGQYPEEVAYGPQIMMDRLGKWLGKYFAQVAQADSAQEDASDPLQGAANWLAEAHGQFSPVVLSGCLMIGYNRAKRLHDAALAARKQGASQ